MKQNRIFKTFGILTMIFGVLAFAANVCLTIFQQPVKLLFTPEQDLAKIFTLPVTSLVISLIGAAIFILFVIFAFNMEAGKRVTMLAVGTGVRLLLNIIAVFGNMIELRIINARYGTDYIASRSILNQAESFTVNPFSLLSIIFMAITLGIAIGINVKNKGVQ